MARAVGGHRDLPAGGQLRDQVATKDDLDQLATRSEMQVGFAEPRTEMAQGTTRLIRRVVTSCAAWSTLLVTAVRLLP
ncbi:MAG: hypothetical protein CL424_05065 [Acidimicrobiaceae bacterium]|nr:hypothetical protein [Acidimicrobiaceae bacterium]